MPDKNSTLTQALVRELLHYDPETGIFTWCRRARVHFPSDRSWKTWNTRFPNTPAGYDNAKGYRAIQTLRSRFYMHHIAWLYVHGRWPMELDHINHDRADNRICNLREVTRFENKQNAPISKVNTSGVVGVHWDKQRNKWRAKITFYGEVRYLGHFDELSDAACARKSAERRLGFHPNHGR